MAEEQGYASFEVREDEETGRRYWFGGEDGWKDGEEVGDDRGCLVLSPLHFAVGTRIDMTEPDLTALRGEREGTS